MSKHFYREKARMRDQEIEIDRMVPLSEMDSMEIVEKLLSLF